MAGNGTRELFLLTCTQLTLSLIHIHAVQKRALRLSHTPVMSLNLRMHCVSYTFVQRSLGHLGHAVVTYLLLLGLCINGSFVRICQCCVVFPRSVL